MTRSRARAIAVVAAVAGGLLFAWSLKTVGVATVVDDVSRLGFGFAAIVALGGVRHLVRAAAWRLCFDDPRELTLTTSVAAYVSGDAIGNVTPFGILASEPSKILVVRDRIAAAAAIPALALENLFYGASVIAMLVAGTVALLAAFDVTSRIRLASLVMVGCAIAAAIAVAVVIRCRPSLIRPLVDFIDRHRDRVWTVSLLEVTYHAAAVFEIWLALRLITGVAPTLLTAFVLEYVNRTITVAFQFVPMWLGVDEAGTGLMTTALGVGGAVGVALALARKARVAVWTAIGLLLLGIFRPRAVLKAGEHEDSYRGRNRLPWTST
jgi:lysylphosphatidylglycerol synthase-like protein